MATQTKTPLFLEDTDQMQEDQRPPASVTEPSVDGTMAIDPLTTQTESTIDLPHRGAPEEDTGTLEQRLQQALDRNATDGMHLQDENAARLLATDSLRGSSANIGNSESNDNTGNTIGGEFYTYNTANDGNQVPQGDSNDFNIEAGQGANPGADQQANGATSGGSGPPNGGNDAAPPSDLPSDQIDLSVRDNDNNVIYFRIRRRSPLKKVFAAYAAQRGGSQRSLRFHLDGVLLSGSDTPETLEMNTGDIIDVAIEQVGGSFLCNLE